MKERLLEVLAKDRYGIKDLASWLGVSYQSAYNKVNGKTLFSHKDIQVLIAKMGKKNVDYIFFS